MYNTSPRYITSNVTGRHRGLKKKLQAGFRVLSLLCMSYLSWYRALSLCYACIWSSGIILIP